MEKLICELCGAQVSALVTEIDPATGAVQYICVQCMQSDSEVQDVTQG